jgi:ATP-dependent DNA helicase RecG
VNSPFAEALEAVHRPLAFASRDAAAADRVRDLEVTVARAASRAAGLAIPRDAREVLARVAAEFAQPLAGDARAVALARALPALERLADPAWAEAALARPLTTLPGIGAKRAELLARRGVRSVGDLLFLLPSRYDDRSRLARVAELEVGLRATFVAQVRVSDFVAGRARRGGRGRGRAFQAVVGDESGTVNLVWFHGTEALQKLLAKGARVLVTGDVRRHRFSKELIHPEVERLDAGDEPDAEAGLERIVPVYPTPEGLHPRALRRLVTQAAAEYADLVPSFLPAAIALRRALPAPADAIRALQLPPADADPAALADWNAPARQRLVLEELFVLEVGLALRRAARAAEPGIALDVEQARIEEAERALPFSLTRAQRRAWDEIRADLARPHPMHRLLQGDVGSGKTAVAFLAAVAAAASCTQAALMAPTELLAEQHERTLRALVEGGGPATRLRLALLTASVPRADAERVRASLADGAVDLVVGTHALVEEDVRFAHLALAIVDEQHRFGVLQRAALSAKAPGSVSPHVLVMTATPIPRTLALTVYGDLDLSVIDELPPGRTPVVTAVLRPGEGRRVADLIRETVARGEQVYVVYPLVEESEKVDLRAATQQAERIRAAFRDCRVDLVHGRLDAAARAEAMERFRRGETQILVSTSVVEVGVDVANATLMVVEHAERFGLAQLHQLRGRVGRAAKPGTCLLVARGASEESEARLAAMLETTDGFRIADADLRIRGPGEFLGTRQSGYLADLRLADLIRDARLVSEAREAALDVVRRDPGLRRSPDLARAVRSRWGERLALANVG